MGLESAELSEIHRNVDTSPEPEVDPTGFVSLRRRRRRRRLPPSEDEGFGSEHEEETLSKEVNAASLLNNPSEASDDGESHPGNR